MQTFKVLSAFYMQDRQALLVVAEGQDARFKRGAKLRDAFGKVYEIDALVSIEDLSSENAARITSFLVKDAKDIGRLVQFVEQ